MLSPKRTKYRKAQKGNNRGKSLRGCDVSFGDFAMQALEPGLPGPPGHEEAARSPHGRGQGRRRRVGGRRPPRPRDVRAPGRRRSDRPRGVPSGRPQATRRLQVSDPRRDHMKASDLREKSVEDLRELQASLAHETFQYRLKNFTNRLDDTSVI